MKKQIIEPDYIGGLGTLTKEEEILLSQYFSSKKEKQRTKAKSKATDKKGRHKVVPA